MPRRPALPLALAGLALAAAPASATWSIVLVNRVTQEVLVASATCLANFDLENGLPVVRVGLGGAAAQALIDSSGANRALLYAGFGAGESPADMLAALALSDPGHATRQYGVVATYDPQPASFTGMQVGQAKAFAAGSFGDGEWVYSIQGNLLTAKQVVQAARNALVGTPGDGGQRVLAAMEAARALGGDGRCSCGAFTPTACGAPPPAPFKSAHVGFVVIARLGDTDGGCQVPAGCANGDYFMNLEFVGGPGDPDPIPELQAQYDAARAALAGIPDGHTTAVASTHAALVADGASTATVTIALADIDGVPLASGGHALAVGSATGAPLHVAVAGVVDHGDGTYTLALQAGTVPGEDLLAITVDHGGPKPATLAPYLALRVDPLAPLHCGVDAVSLGAGGTAPLALNVEPGAPYLVLGTLSGTVPGVLLPEGLVPLNPDALTTLMASQPGPPAFPGTFGVADAAGRAAAAVVVPPAFDPALAGGRVDLAALVLGAALGITNAAGFDLEP